MVRSDVAFDEQNVISGFATDADDRFGDGKIFARVIFCIDAFDVWHWKCPHVWIALLVTNPFILDQIFSTVGPSRQIYRLQQRCPLSCYIEPMEEIALW